MAHDQSLQQPPIQVVATNGDNEHEQNHESRLSEYQHTRAQLLSQSLPHLKLQPHPLPPLPTHHHAHGQVLLRPPLPPPPSSSSSSSSSTPSFSLPSPVCLSQQLPLDSSHATSSPTPSTCPSLISSPSISTPSPTVPPPSVKSHLQSRLTSTPDSINTTGTHSADDNNIILCPELAPVSVPHQRQQQQQGIKRVNSILVVPPTRTTSLQPLPPSTSKSKSKSSGMGQSLSTQPQPTLSQRNHIQNRDSRTLHSSSKLSQPCLPETHSTNPSPKPKPDQVPHHSSASTPVLAQSESPANPLKGTGLPKETAGSKIRRAFGGVSSVGSRKRKKSEIEFEPVAHRTGLPMQSQDDLPGSGLGSSFDRDRDNEVTEFGVGGCGNGSRRQLENVQGQCNEKQPQAQNSSSPRNRNNLTQLARRVASKAALLASSSPISSTSSSTSLQQHSPPVPPIPPPKPPGSGSELGSPLVPVSMTTYVRAAAPVAEVTVCTATSTTTTSVPTPAQNALQASYTKQDQIQGQVGVRQRQAGQEQARVREQEGGSGRSPNSRQLVMTQEVSSAVGCLLIEDSEGQVRSRLRQHHQEHGQFQPRAAEISKESWRRSDSTIGKHTVLLSAAGLSLGARQLSGCGGVSAGTRGTGSRPVSMADSVKSTTSVGTIVPGRANVGQGQRLSWNWVVNPVADVEGAPRLQVNEKGANRDDDDDDDGEEEDYEEIPPATPEKDVQFIHRSTLPAAKILPASVPTNVTPTSSEKRLSNRRSMSLSIVTTQAAQALLSKSKSKLLRSPPASAGTGVQEFSSPSPLTATSNTTVWSSGKERGVGRGYGRGKGRKRGQEREKGGELSLEGDNYRENNKGDQHEGDNSGGYVAVEIVPEVVLASSSVPATPMTSASSLSLSREHDVLVHTPGGGRSKAKLKGVVFSRDLSGVTDSSNPLSSGDIYTADGLTEDTLDARHQIQATPSPARQLAKRAVEKMGLGLGLGLGRAWGLHGHSFSHPQPHLGPNSGMADAEAEGMARSAPLSSDMVDGRGRNGNGGGRRAYTSPNPPSQHHQRWRSAGTELGTKQHFVRFQEASPREAQVKAPKKGKSCRLRRTPDAPSMSSIHSSTSAASSSDAQSYARTGPRLGKQLRGSVGGLISNEKSNSKKRTLPKGVVFGRDLISVVRETAVGVRFRTEGEQQQTYGEICDGPIDEMGMWPAGQELDELTKARKEKFDDHLSALERRKLPAVVVRCAQHLLIWGIQEEGLFRVNGRSLHISTLRAEFDSGSDFDMMECGPADLDPHSVSSLFKAFLRELPEPLLTHALTPYFDAALSQDSARQDSPDRAHRVSVRGPGLPSNPRDGSSSSNFATLRKPPSLSTLSAPSLSGMRPPSKMLLKALKSLLAQLPDENRDLIRTVTELIRATAGESKQTKMPLSNLMLVFCPSLNMNPPLLKVLCEADGIWGDEEQEQVQEGEGGSSDVLILDIRRDEQSRVLDIRAPSLVTDVEEDEETEESTHMRSSEDGAYLGSAEDAEVPLTDDSSYMTRSVTGGNFVSGPEDRGERSILPDDQSSYVSTSEDQESSWPPVLTSSTSTDSLDTPESISQHGLMPPIPSARGSPRQDSAFRLWKSRLVPGVVIADPSSTGLLSSSNPDRPAMPPPVSYPLPVAEAESPDQLVFPSTSEVKLVPPSPATSNKPSKRRSLPRISLPSLPPLSFRNIGSISNPPTATNQSPPSAMIRQPTWRPKKKPSLKLRFTKKDSSSSSLSSSLSQSRSQLQLPAPSGSDPSVSTSSTSTPSSSSSGQRRASSECSPASITPVTIYTAHMSTPSLPPKLDIPLASSPLKFAGYGFGMSPPSPSSPLRLRAEGRAEAERIETKAARKSWKLARQQQSTPVSEWIPERVASPASPQYSSSSSRSLNLSQTGTMMSFSLVGESHYPEASTCVRPRPTPGRSGMMQLEDDGLALMDEQDFAEDWTRTVLLAARVDE